MTTLIATITLLTLSAPAVSASQKVRIGLFSLFKPEVIYVRVASGDGALLDMTGLASGRPMICGESVRVRLSGNRLTVGRGSSLGGVKHSVTASGLRIVPIGSATLELDLPGRIRRAVRGAVSVEVDGRGGGGLKIVLTTDRESAIASVVAAETSQIAPEALKALAIVVRTFMLSHADRHSKEGFDFCDTTHCQLYRGEQDLSDPSDASVAVSRAVDATARQFLSFEGAAVEGHYTAACGGISATPSMVWGGGERYPYSRIVCGWCRASRFAHWQRSARVARVLKALSQATGLNLSSATEIVTDSDQPSGLVRSITMRDGSNRTVLATDAFRRAIGLKLGWNTVLSPSFTIERRGSRFIFRGRGFGSQVGLCEAGAFAQAAAGRTYREILKFYYPVADIAELPHD